MTNYLYHLSPAQSIPFYKVAITMFCLPGNKLSIANNSWDLLERFNLFYILVAPNFEISVESAKRKMHVIISLQVTPRFKKQSSLTISPWRAVPAMCCFQQIL